jgi:hypothetical protein
MRTSRRIIPLHLLTDHRLDALAALVTYALQPPTGDGDDLAGNAGGGWRGKEDYGLGDIVAFSPTL